MHLQILEMPLIFIVIGFVVPVFAAFVILIGFVDVLQVLLLIVSSRVLVTLLCHLLLAITLTVDLHCSRSCSTRVEGWPAYNLIGRSGSRIRCRHHSLWVEGRRRVDDMLISITTLIIVVGHFILLPHELLLRSSIVAGIL